MNKPSPENIFVAGHNGMVGSAVVRALKGKQNVNLITRSRSELDLENQTAVQAFLQSQAIDKVYLCAARVGGIHANNTFPADFIYRNLAIQNNIIHQSYQAGINQLLFLGSSCIYPRHCPQPINESSLLEGPLERTNEPYAIAKIAGIKLCDSYNRQYGTDYRSVMPTNLYGPNDNFHPENSHVIPGLMHRIHEAEINGDQSVQIWGTGKAMREFLHVDDMADACVFLMEQEKKRFYDYRDPNASDINIGHINIGTGEDVTIAELAQAIARVVGFSGQLKFDPNRPDGTPRKLLNVDRLHTLGWKHQLSLEAGLSDTYAWYLANLQRLRLT